MRKSEKRVLTTGRLVLIISVIASITTLGITSFPNSMSFAKLLGLDHLHEDTTAGHEAEAAPLPVMIDDLLKQNLKAGDAANNRYLKIEEDFIDPDNHCEFCQRYEYVPGPAGRAGIGYGPEDGGGSIDLSGARKVFFFVMGENGGEKLRFKVAGNDVNANDLGSNAANGNQGARGTSLPFGITQNDTRSSSVANANGELFVGKAFAKTTDEVSLTDDWKRYEIDLANVDMTDIENPFALEVLKGGGGKQVFYVKGITFDTDPAVNPLPTIELNVTALDGNLTLSTESVTENNTSSNATALDEELTDNATSADDNDTSTVIPDNSDGNDTAEQDGVSDEGELENNLENATGSQDSNSTELAATEESENKRPTAVVQPDEILAHPGDSIILDATNSEDPDGDDVSFSWEPKDSGIKIAVDADGPTPTLTVSPEIDEDQELSVELVASDGNLESEPYPVTIIVDYLESPDAPEDGIFSDEEAILQLEPIERSDVSVDTADFEDLDSWEPSDNDCSEDVAECISDNSDATYVTAEEEAGDIFIYDPSEALTRQVSDSDIRVNYISAQIEARSVESDGGSDNEVDGNSHTAYVSLVLFDEEEGEYFITPPISISSDSFESYSYRWTTDSNGNRWDREKLEQTILVGYVYFAGSSPVQISEFTMDVSYYPALIEDEVIQEETDTEQEVEEEDSSDSVQDNVEEQEETDDSENQLIEDLELVEDTSIENATSDGIPITEGDLVDESQQQ